MCWCRCVATGYHLKCKLRSEKLISHKDACVYTPGTVSIWKIISAAMLSLNACEVHVQISTMLHAACYKVFNFAHISLTNTVHNFCTRFHCVPQLCPKGPLTVAAKFEAHSLYAVTLTFPLTGTRMQGCTDRWIEFWWSNIHQCMTFCLWMSCVVRKLYAQSINISIDLLILYSS